MLASEIQISHKGKVISSDCSIVVNDSNSNINYIILTVTEIFNLKEGIDLILSMNWFCANMMSISWDISDWINFYSGIDLSEGVNIEKLVAQDNWVKLEGEVAFEGLENLNMNMDVQIVSLLSDWDNVIINDLAGSYI